MITNEWLKAIVPIGILSENNSWTPSGAGTMILVDDYVWIVTAGHVIKEDTSNKICVLINHKTKGVEIVPLSEIYSVRSRKIDWIYDDSADIAIGPMPVLPEWELKAITKNYFKDISEVSPSMECLTVGCPYGIRGVDPNHSTPLVLGGIIAGVNADERKMYIQAPIFPGNSGGPIIVKIPPYSSGSLKIGVPTTYLAGIVTGYTITNNPHPRDGSNLPPLHLGVGISITKAIDLVKSDMGKNILNNISYKNNIK